MEITFLLLAGLTFDKKVQKYGMPLSGKFYCAEQIKISVKLPSIYLSPAEAQ